MSTKASNQLHGSQKQKIHHSIEPLLTTVNWMSTKGSAQPDGTPCRHFVEKPTHPTCRHLDLPLLPPLWPTVGLLVREEADLRGRRVAEGGAAGAAEGVRVTVRYIS